MIKGNRESEVRRIARVTFSRPIVIVSAVMVGICVLTASFAPLLAPYPPNEPNFTELLQQPSRKHLLGTDELGRDLLSRIIYGSRISLLVGVFAVLIAGMLGMSLGLVAGYFGGWIETVIMRFIDAVMAFPPILLALAIATMLGGGLRNVLIALGMAMLPTYCRLMCGQIISLKQRDYITAARILGASNLRIMARHLLVNAFPPMLVLLTINIGTAILSESSLSFLGIGILPPTATWGNMVSGGYKHLLRNPILSFAPGGAILLVVLSLNILGDGLRDALDPRLRGRI